MKRLAIVAAVFVIAACTASDDTTVDTAAVMTPAPADTGMMMRDTMMMHDTMMRDTTP